MRILIVDDHTLFRRGFQLVLARLYPEAEIAEAGDVAGALAALQPERPFDLILLDLALPGMEDLNGLHRLKRAAPASAIVMVSAIGEPQRIRDSLAAGARGYLLKSVSDVTVGHALSLVLAGEIYVPAEGLAQAAAAFSGDHPLAGLTDRQRDVLSFLMGGQSNKEIARQLGLLESTVKAHVKVILNKLKADNRTQAAMIAAAAGLRPAQSDAPPTA